MKRIRLIYTLTLFVLVASMGCSNSKNKTTLTASGKVRINGNSSEYIEVVPGSYDMTLMEKTLTLPVKFKIIKQFDPTNFDKSSTSIGYISLQISDSKGNPIPMAFGVPFSPASVGDWDKVKSLLTSAVGTEQTINFSYGGILASETDVQNIIDNASSFEVMSADIVNTVNEINKNTNEIAEVENRFIGHWYVKGNRARDMVIKREQNEIKVIVNGKNDIAHLEYGKLITEEDGNKIEISFNETTGRLTVEAGSHTMEFEK